MQLRILVSVVILLNIFEYDAVASAEQIERSFSTSVAGMKELLVIEKKLVEIFTNYANELQTKLNTIQTAIAQMNAELQKSDANVEAYLSNPLNGFSLVRRMHADWVYWERYMTKPVSEIYVPQIKALRASLPTSTDLQEATNAIRRLQTTYEMKPADMAVGLLNGKQYDVKLTALDLYAIGHELLKQGRMFEASFYLYTSLETYADSNINKVLEFNKRKIYEVYAEALFQQDRYKDAQTVLVKALEHEPGDVELIKRKFDIELYETTRASLKPPIVFSPEEVTTYHVGCRGGFPMRPYPLHCRYNRTTTPFTKLAPIKMEEISADPYMVLYHDIISDEEIQHLKDMSSSTLQRATVFNETDGKPVVVSTRTSKFSWLHDNMTEITKRLNRRITDMTGLDVYGSEMLQVMNYGLGGHYDTHVDFFNFTGNEEVVRMQGDRIATVLFYMSDVEQGGATVFPYIKVAVLPQKGAAVMWYNLNNRGEGDRNTIHAACPVIVGSKWVCNKWIREKNQFRNRPCPRA